MRVALAVVGQQDAPRAAEHLERPGHGLRRYNIRDLAACHAAERLARAADAQDAPRWQQPQDVGEQRVRKLGQGRGHAARGGATGADSGQRANAERADTAGVMTGSVWG